MADITDKTKVSIGLLISIILGVVSVVGVYWRGETNRSVLEQRVAAQGVEIASLKTAQSGNTDFKHAMDLRMSKMEWKVDAIYNVIVEPIQSAKGSK